MICKAMERADKLSGRDPAAAEFIRAYLQDEISQLYESADE